MIGCSFAMDGQPDAQPNGNAMAGHTNCGCVFRFGWCFMFRW